jgi:hypothetical protein
VLPEREGSITSISHTTSQYRSDRYFFTIEYPNDLVVREIDEKGATTILFQKPGEAKGFQIFVVRYRNDIITEKQFKKDLGGALPKDPRNITLPENIRAVHFKSESSVLGSTTEVWFIYKGYLYEITTYAELDSWLASILNTLHFEQ